MFDSLSGGNVVAFTVSLPGGDEPRVALIHEWDREGKLVRYHGFANVRPPGTELDAPLSGHDPYAARGSGRLRCDVGARRWHHPCAAVLATFTVPPSRRAVIDANAA
jgi:hypothetical protein